MGGISPEERACAMTVSAVFICGMARRQSVFWSGIVVFYYFSESIGGGTSDLAGPSARTCRDVQRPP